MNISAPPLKAREPGNPKFARDAWLRALANTAKIGERNETLPIVIERLAARFGDAPALTDPQTEMSFDGLARRANQYARLGVSLGLLPGDAAALMMNNSAEYVAVWLGLTRIGVVVALVNSQLSGDALLHSIKVANPKAVIAGADLAARVASIRGKLPQGVACFVHGASAEDFTPLAPLLAALPGEAMPLAECAPPPLDAMALYIYTSGDRKSVV